MKAATWNGFRVTFSGLNALLAWCGIVFFAVSCHSGVAQTAAPAAPAAPFGSISGPSVAPSQTSPATENSTSQTQRRAQDADNPQDRRPDASPGLQDIETEFQQMAAATTGRPVPIFGASLFNRVPTTFAPVDDTPVTPDYVIGPGDEIRLQVWGQVNQQGTFRVDRTGAISLPQVGTVHVAGLQFLQLNDFLRAQLGRVYRNFDLNVNMGQLRSIQVFIVGRARRPGSYTISSMSTLLNALFASGGPVPQGSLRDIQVKRNGKTVDDFDLYDLLLHGDKTKDIALSPGDVIFIPEAGPQVAVVGSVNNPAIYELRNETTLQEVLSLAGGRTTVAAGSVARVERIYEHTMRSVLDVDLAKNESIALQNGDIVLITAIVDRFKDAVTLRGNVANPGRYVWHAGMRISDLIPNKESLVTRNYWRKRNQLGQLATDYAPQSVDTEGSLGVRGAPPTQAGSAQGGSMQVGPTQVGPTQAGSTDGATVKRGGTTSQVGGSSVGAALTSNTNVFTAKTDVILSAPDIDWSYAVIERQSAKDLTTSLLSFNLGKIMLEGDQTQNLELLPGDVVTIFSTADLRVPTTQQTRFVRLEGEFVGAGVYSVLPGETLRQLLKRAGGFTSDAYLYASEFTRESTRRVEQQRLREYADQLEAQVSAATASTSARAVNDRDAAAAQASAVDAREAIARLRATQPVGRIVLELRPDSRGVQAVPDLALEDGDRFIVPRVPSNVNVEGQVYSANAFVFDRGRRVIDYLRQAGGPDRQADRKRAFVLRADGSVYSRQYGNLEHATVFPGDTIVVPPLLDKRALLRSIVDIATIIGQVGFGVAAINVLR